MEHLHLPPCRGLTGIYRPAWCHAKAGENTPHSAQVWKATCSGTGGKQLACTFFAHTRAAAPPVKPGSLSAPVALQPGMEQAASLGAVLGAAPALHKSPREKCGFQVLIHPLAQR